MTVYQEARLMARLVCWDAVGAAAKIVLEEEGVCGVLKLTAHLARGEVIQGAVAARLEKEASMICPT